ncbi:glycerophosphodiester phosphodiesterase [Microbulbifer celer]|uniref:Glycerophosphodiester phosphodiesterase n=1 Tax=Microbulbifer celer TaxID=435905 RepID=A0ABW3UF95_9GAMM|nr:glycerophosphodiester phosphodiesterase [Microbulbifer celer]UFN55966.1 glycerophosphodiester phosphodiesterase [Microbulbifer celer]
MQDADTLFCFAHRGYPKRATENTLQAITHALEFDIDGVEIDVWNVGGELIVKHDRRLGRLLAGQELLTDLSPAEVRKRLLPGGEQVPTLYEVLELVGNHVQLNIELKGPNCAELATRVLESYVRDNNATFEQYLFSSFDHRQVYECLQRLPQVRRGALVDGVPLDLAALGEPLKAYSIHHSLNFVCPEIIADARQRGFKNYVFTVNHRHDLELVAAMGADGVFTDEPQLIMDYNQSRTAEMMLEQLAGSDSNFPLP